MRQVPINSEKRHQLCCTMFLSGVNLHWTCGTKSFLQGLIAFWFRPSLKLFFCHCFSPRKTFAGFLPCELDKFNATSPCGFLWVEKGKILRFHFPAVFPQSQNETEEKNSGKTHAFLVLMTPNEAYFCELLSSCCRRSCSQEEILMWLAKLIKNSCVSSIFSSQKAVLSHTVAAVTTSQYFVSNLQRGWNLSSPSAPCNVVQSIFPFTWKKK